MNQSYQKHFSVSKNNMEHTYAQSLLLIYIIYNYIIYKFVSPCPAF